MVNDPEQQPLKGSPSHNVHYISIPINRDPIDDTSPASTPYNIGSRRQSILDQPFGSFRGVNSLGRFATSFQRANAFKAIEVNHEQERSYFKDGYDETYDPDTLAPSFDGRRLSIAFKPTGGVALSPSMNNLYDSAAARRDTNAIVDDNDDSSIFGGAARSILSTQQSLLRPTVSFQDFNAATDLDTHSIIVKQVETKDGKTVTVLAGQSTAPQTIFNSINVLIGIGLLALPLGMKYAGWVLGVPMLLTFAFATFCSAELLSRCLDTDPTLISYGDLGYAAFGPKGRAFISFLFALDLLGSGVALIILFGDSLNALFPQYSVTFFKIVGFFVVTPQIFMPLSILSNVSLLGIISTISIVLTVVFCGLYKSSSPGSLTEPMETHLFPSSFKNFCLSIGLLSACWGGHAIFPNLKSDMRHPEKFKDCLKTTYTITSITDIGIAIVGFLMFGNMVKDEITKSVMLTPGYPDFIYVMISALLSMIPLAKTPLNARPIVALLDIVMGINHTESEYEAPKFQMTRVLKFFNRIFVNVVLILIAIKFPEFDKLLAFCGAGLCFLICSILPCLFYLKICAATIKPWERVTCWVVIAISAVLSVLGVGAAIA